MRTIAFLILLLAAQPVNASVLGFLFGSPQRHHHHVYRHHHRPPRIVHRTIVKKIIIVRERKDRAATVDRTPITPLK